MYGGCQQNNGKRNSGIFVFMINDWGVIYLTRLYQLHGADNGNDRNGMQ
jgi:hypothetical protein